MNDNHNSQIDVITSLLKIDSTKLQKTIFSQDIF